MEKYKIFSLTRNQLRNHLFKELIGKIFHITSFESFLSIISAGYINNNKKLEYTLNWESNSYFRNRGCVSVCDLFNNTRPKKIRSASFSSYPIFEQGNNGITVILFLKKEAYDNVKTWESWKKEKAFTEMVVPHLESGYPDKIPLDIIDEIWIVQTKDHINIS